MYSSGWSQSEKKRVKLVRITTVPESLDLLMRGQLGYFRQRGFDVIAISSSGPQVKLITEREQCQHFAIPFTRKITPIKDIISLFRLVLLLHKIKPYIVHTHTPKAGLIGMLASWICRVPVRLHTVAGLPLMEKSGLTKRLLMFTESITYKCAHKIYPNSIGLLKFMEQHFITQANKFSLIGKGSTNGIDTDFFSTQAIDTVLVDSIKARLKLSDDDFVFLFVGRIVKAKGIAELVLAFEKLRLDFPKIQLMLIGNFETDLDPLDEAIQKIINESNAIKMPGFQTDVRPWFQLAHAFVFPSYREGLPNVVMQAASMEVPCIVSDINGCNELIRNDETGWVVPPKNIKELEMAMRDCYLNPAKRQLFKLSARNFIKENYQQAVLWRYLEEEYRVQLESSTLFYNSK